MISKNLKTSKQTPKKNSQNYKLMNKETMMNPRTLNYLIILTIQITCKQTLALLKRMMMAPPHLTPLNQIPPLHQIHNLTLNLLIMKKVILNPPSTLSKIKYKLNLGKNSTKKSERKKSKKRYSSAKTIKFKK